jgi:hypothetical protein
VLGVFAVLSLGLTMLGVFGIVALLVGARLKEAGIRLALGASPRTLILTMLNWSVPVLGCRQTHEALTMANLAA